MVPGQFQSALYTYTEWSCDVHIWVISDANICDRDIKLLQPELLGCHCTRFLINYIEGEHLRNYRSIFEIASLAYMLMETWP